MTQGLLMGSVAAVITVLLLLGFLDSPFGTGIGTLEPTAMERTLRITDEALGAAGAAVRPPCDAQGLPR